MNLFFQLRYSLLWIFYLQDSIHRLCLEQKTFRVATRLVCVLIFIVLLQISVVVFFLSERIQIYFLTLTARRFLAVEMLLFRNVCNNLDALFPSENISRRHLGLGVEVNCFFLYLLGVELFLLRICLQSRILFLQLRHLLCNFVQLRLHGLHRFAVLFVFLNEVIVVALRK